MDFPVQLFINALIAGILLGGFYAAVTIGISISFGILDIVNIAHPAFIILGSYIAYIVEPAARARPDPGQHPGAAGLLLSRLAGLSGLLRRRSRNAGRKRLRGLAFFFGLLFVTEVC